MALTKSFKQTIAERAEREPAFAQALLDEAATLFLNGEPEMARVILRDLVNATVGFESLAKETAKPSKSLHRMLSVSGNPSICLDRLLRSAVQHARHVDGRGHGIHWQRAGRAGDVEQFLHLDGHQDGGRVAGQVRHRRQPERRSLKHAALLVLLRLGTAGGAARAYPHAVFRRD